MFYGIWHIELRFIAIFVIRFSIFAGKTQFN